MNGLFNSAHNPDAAGGARPAPAPGVRVRGDGYYGRRYPGASADTVALAARWLRDGPPPGAIVLKPGAVYRFDDLAVKRFAPHRGPARWLRRLPAMRAAAEYYRVWPVPAPAPLVAVGLHNRAGESLLVTEFVQGETLRQAWNNDLAARAALPALVAALYRHRIRFGDLHAQNLIWDGHMLHLVDLDAMRNPAHRLERLSVRWWLALLRSLKDEEGVRIAHDACFELLGRDPEPNWRKVLSQSPRTAR